MSQENVEIVRRHMEAAQAGNYDVALGGYDPAVVFDASVRPEGGLYHGREGVAEAMRVWVGAWEEWRVDVRELLDAGDKVLLVGSESGRGKGSGVEIGHDVFALFTLRDGLIVRWEAFLDRRKALEAVGLSE